MTTLTSWVLFITTTWTLRQKMDMLPLTWRLQADVPWSRRRSSRHGHQTPARKTMLELGHVRQLGPVHELRGWYNHITRMFLNINKSRIYPSVSESERNKAQITVNTQTSHAAAEDVPLLAQDGFTASPDRLLCKVWLNVMSGRDEDDNNNIYSHTENTGVHSFLFDVKGFYQSVVFTPVISVPSYSSYTFTCLMLFISFCAFTSFLLSFYLHLSYILLCFLLLSVHVASFYRFYVTVVKFLCVCVKAHADKYRNH